MRSADPGRRRSTSLHLGAVLGLAAFVLAAFGTSSPVSAAVRRAAIPPAVAPLDTSKVGPSGTVALLAMGHLDDPTNTFWQAFDLPAKGTRWTLRTPPGVADNSGLVAAISARQIVIGFRPSAKLTFSPLATTRNQGSTYTPGLIPAGLAGVPDALSVASDGAAYALTSTSVLAGRSSLSGWRPAISLGAAQSASATASCGIETLTAVAGLARGMALAADCSHAGTVGIYDTGRTGLRSIGPRLQGPSTEGPVAVVRLVDYGSGLAALLETGTGRTRAYIPAWTTSPSAAWTVGPTLRSGTPISTSTTLNGGLEVLSAGPGVNARAATIQPGQTAWMQLPPTPPGTATIATTAGRTDALAVDTSQFTDYRLAGDHWIQAQTIRVPIAYGSSG